MEFRTAAAEDADQLAALHAESWRRTYRGMMSDAFLDGEVVDDRRTIWHARLRAPAANQCILLAEKGRAFEGFICVYGDEDSRWGSLIDNLHVRHDTQKTGVGRGLMHEAAAWLERRYSGLGVYLWVMQKNTNAQQFYARLGGVDREAAARPNTAGGGIAYVYRYVWDNPTSLLSHK